jgi:hypothetical protein
VGASPEELVEDIARHRDNLGATLDAIEQRVRPASVLRRHPAPLVVALAVLGGLTGWVLGGRGRH